MGGPETGENQRTTAARIYAYMREISQKYERNIPKNDHFHGAMRGNIPPSGGRPGRGCRTESHPSPRSTAPRKTGDFGAGGGAKPRAVCADENLRRPKPFSGRLRAHRAPDEVEGVDRRARLDELLVPPEIPLVAENLAPRVQGDIGVPRNGG